MKFHPLSKFGVFSLFVFLHNVHASQCTPEQVQKMMNSGFSKDEIMKICVSSSETSTQEQSSKIDLPKIDWGVAEEYFYIKNPQIGKYKFRNPLGQIYMLDAIEFNITAKSEVPFMLMLNAVFYDSDGVKMDESILTIEKKYNTGFWQEGDPGKGYITVKDLKTLSDVRVIRITNFGP